MDPKLLRQREIFQTRVMALPVVEKRTTTKVWTKDQATVIGIKNNNVNRGKSFLSHVKAAVNQANTTIQQLNSGSQYRFSILYKMVKHLRKQFLELEDHPLKLDELLNEIGVHEVTPDIKVWLFVNGISSQPKIQVTGDGLLSYKPPLPCREKKSLLRLLKTYDLKGLGGIMKEDIEDSVPNSERVLKQLESEIFIVNRQDKKQVIFYNPRQIDMTINEEFKEQWRGVNVATIDIEKIEEYLQKQGIRLLQKADIRRPCAAPEKKKKKVAKKPKDNEHVADMLEHYDE